MTPAAEASSRIRAQMAVAAEYATGGITGFSVPEYMTPLGGPAAAELLLQYQALIVLKHRRNLERLWRGTEPRLGERRTRPAALADAAVEAEP